MRSRPPVCDYEGSDYQQRFWDAGERVYEDLAEAAAIEQLLPSGDGPLLEIGAGAGRNSGRYHGYRPCVLADYSHSQLQQARARLGDTGRFRFVVADAYALPFANGAFAAATMIRTLHHMAAPRQALAQARRVLRRGGFFLLEYANKRNLKAIARWLLRRQSWSPFAPEPVEFARLNFDFHPRQVRQWLLLSGLRPRRQRTVSHFRIGWLKRLLPAGWLVAMDRLAGLTGDLWQLSPSVFVRAQAVAIQPDRD